MLDLAGVVGTERATLVSVDRSRLDGGRELDDRCGDVLGDGLDVLRADRTREGDRELRGEDVVEDIGADLNDCHAENGRPTVVGKSTTVIGQSRLTCQPRLAYDVSRKR